MQDPQRYRQFIHEPPLKPIDQFKKAVGFSMSLRARGVFFFIVFLTTILITSCNRDDPVWAETTPPENLYKGLIGEAVSEGYEGMYAVACVYRNRLEKGMSLGCVALKRRDLDEFVRKQGKKYEIMAKEIVYKVFTETDDITKGATHYENIERFGIPGWAKNMVRTVKIGRHTFYKEK